MCFNEKVYAIVLQIPAGKVASYGQIAWMAGSPRAARAVGIALRNNPYGDELPCHRVVHQDGKPSEAFDIFSKGLQRQLLMSEGVGFTANGCVDMENYRWNGDSWNFEE
jgi:methylated-DNA-protein-cysteine methyltransferase-like protein